MSGTAPHAAEQNGSWGDDMFDQDTETHKFITKLYADNVLNAIPRLQTSWERKNSVSLIVLLLLVPTSVLMYVFASLNEDGDTALHNAPLLLAPLAIASGLRLYNIKVASYRVAAADATFSAVALATTGLATWLDFVAANNNHLKMRITKAVDITVCVIALANAALGLLCVLEIRSWAAMMQYKPNYNAYKYREAFQWYMPMSMLPVSIVLWLCTFVTHLVYYGVRYHDAGIDAHVYENAVFTFIFSGPYIGCSLAQILCYTRVRLDLRISFAVVAITGAIAGCVLDGVFTHKSRPLVQEIGIWVFVTVFVDALFACVTAVRTSFKPPGARSKWNLCCDACSGPCRVFYDGLEPGPYLESAVCCGDPFADKTAVAAQPSMLTQCCASLGPHQQSQPYQRVDTRYDPEAFPPAPEQQQQQQQQMLTPPVAVPAQPPPPAPATMGDMARYFSTPVRRRGGDVRQLGS